MPDLKKDIFPEDSEAFILWEGILHILNRKQDIFLQQTINRVS